MSRYFTIANGNIADSIYSLPIESNDLNTNTVLISSSLTKTPFFEGKDTDLYGVSLNLSARSQAIDEDLIVNLHNKSSDSIISTNTYKISSFASQDSSYNYITISPQNWQVLKFNTPVNISSNDKYYLSLSTTANYISFVGGETAINSALGLEGVLYGRLSNNSPYDPSYISKSFCLSGEKYNYIEFDVNQNYALGNFFTIDGYFYFTDLSQKWIPLINNGTGWGSGGTAAWGLAYNTTESSFYFWRYTDTEEKYFKFRANININKWTFIAISRNNQNLSFWVDGVCLSADARHTTNYSAATSSDKLLINFFITENNGYSGNIYVSNIRIRNTSTYNPSIQVPVDPLSIRKQTSLLYAEPYLDYYLAADPVTNNLIFNLFEEPLNIYNSVDASLFIPQLKVPTDALVKDEDLPLYNIVGYSHLNFDKTYYYTAPASYGNLDKTDFTVEAWVYVPSVSAFTQDIQQICSYSLSAFPENTFFDLNIILTETDFPRLQGLVCLNSSYYGEIAGYITPDVWNHICLVKQENKIKTFIQGIKESEITVPDVLNNSTDYIFSVGGDKNNNKLFYGMLSNIRFHRGYAIYTENFSDIAVDQGASILDPSPLAPFNKYVESTKPASPSPLAYDAGDAFNVFQNTSNITLANSDLFENSSEKTFFLNSSSQELTFKFNINNNLNLGDKNFTIEGWINLTTLPISDLINQSYIFLQLLGRDSTSLTVYIGQTTILLSLPHITSYQSPRFIHNLQINTWHHISIVYKEGELYYFVDGSLLKADSDLGTGRDLYSYKFRTFAPLDRFNINNINSGKIKLYGAISNLRVIRGTALYSKNFTSTLPGQANINDPEPFNNLNYSLGAGVHRIEKATGYVTDITPYAEEYSFGSLYFNGNSTYIPPNPAGDFYFGETSDACLEFWIKPEIVSDTQTTHRILGTYGWPYDGFVLRLNKNTTNQLILELYISKYDGAIQSDAIISCANNPIEYDTWSFICFVRIRRGILIFINDKLAATLTPIFATDFIYSWNIKSNTLIFGSAASEYFKGYISDIRISTDVTRFKNITPADINTSIPNVLPVQPLSTSLGDPSAAATQTSLTTNLQGFVRPVKDSPFLNYPDEQSILLTHPTSYAPLAQVKIPPNNLDMSESFTIEGWIKRKPNANYLIIVRGTNSIGYTWYFNIQFEPTSTDTFAGLEFKVTAYIRSTPEVYAYRVDYTFEEDKWYHVAVTRSSTNQYAIFIDGVYFTPNLSVSPGMPFGRTELTPSRGLYIGLQLWNPNQGGYISNVRLASQTVYTVPADLKPPTINITPVVPDSNSLVWLKSSDQQQQIVSYVEVTYADREPSKHDYAGNGPHAIGSTIDNTLYPGAAILSHMGPHSNTVYIDNRIDARCEGDFTLEFFLKIQINTPDCNIYGMAEASWMGRNSGSVGGIRYLKNGRKIGFGSHLGAELFTSSLAVDTWHHIAIVRSSGTVGIYCNGVLASNTATSNSVFGHFSPKNNSFYVVWPSMGRKPVNVGYTDSNIYFADLHFARNETITTRSFSKIEPISDSTIFLVRGICNFEHTLSDSYKISPEDLYSTLAINTADGPPGFITSFNYPRVGWPFNRGHKLLNYTDFVDLFNNQINSGDFTIEYWWKSTHSDALWCGGDGGGGLGDKHLVHRATTGHLHIGFSSTLKYTFFSYDLRNSANWKHIAIVRQNSRIGVYINGSPIALVSTTTKQAAYSHLVPETFNFDVNAGYLFFGPSQPIYIQDFHITKTAKYEVSDTSIASITVPTSPLSEAEFENSVVVKASGAPPLFEQDDSITLTGLGDSVERVSSRLELPNGFVLDFWFYPSDTTFAPGTLLASSYGGNFWYYDWYLIANQDSTFNSQITSNKKLNLAFQSTRSSIATKNACLKFKQWNHIALEVKKAVKGNKTPNLTIFVNGQVELVGFLDTYEPSQRVAGPNFIGRPNGNSPSTPGSYANIQILASNTFNGVPTSAPTITSLTKFLYQKPYTYISSVGGILYQFQTLDLPHSNSNGLYIFKNSTISASITENSLNINLNNPFTIQFWLYLHNIQSCSWVVQLNNYGIGLDSNKIILLINNSRNFTSSNILPTNTWHHIALTQDAFRNISLYVNGELLIIRTLTSNSPDVRSLIFDPSKQLNGHISDICVLKENIYNNAPSFTLPTSVPNIYEKTIYQPTKDYNHIYNYYENAFPFLLKPNSSVFHEKSPFGEGIDGSMKPNTIITGEVDLDNTITIGEQDFTVEWWDYVESMSSPSVQGSFTLYDSGPHTYFPIFQATSTTTSANDSTAVSCAHSIVGGLRNFEGTILSLQGGIGTNIDLGARVLFRHKLTFNEWNHYAIVKSGTTYTLYKNGTKTATSSMISPSLASWSSITIGNVKYLQRISIGVLWGNNPTVQRNGYISNIRFVLDEALYSGDTISVPTEPLSYIPKTVFLYKAPYSTEYVTTNNSSTLALVLGEKVLDFDASPFVTEKEDSMFFDGTYTHDITNSSSLSYDLGASEFTVETWIYNIDLKDCVLFSRNEYSLYIKSKNLQWDFKIKNSNNVISVIFKDFTRYLYKWVHVAVTYNGSAFNLYINGVRKDIQAVPLGTLLATNSNITRVTIGNIHNAVSSNTKLCYFGYISNFRISSECLYTASEFTVPTEPLTSSNSTILLLSSPYPENNFKYLTDDPFPTIVPEKTGFLNNFKYLKTVDALPYINKNFTIELWFYFVRTNKAKEYIIDGRTPNTDEPFLVGLNESPNQVRIQETSTNYIDVGHVLPNTWYHLAIVRNGNYIQVYINGVIEGGMYSTVKVWPGNKLLIGKKNSDSISKECNFIGYISNLRILREEAIYNTNFSPPSVPHTKNSTYTFLLEDRYSINSSVLTTETKSLDEILEEDIHLSSALTENSIEERNITLQSSEIVNNLYIHNKATLNVSVDANTELHIVGEQGLQITSEGKLNIT